MKEKLLYEWKRKNDILEMDIQENERKLGYAIERQKDLKRDIIAQIGIAVVCYIIVCFLFGQEGSISVYFAVTYHVSIYVIAILAILYNGIQVIRAVTRYIHHTKVVNDWKKPRARVSNKEWGIEPEPSFQVEIQKISWILEQYGRERLKMRELWRRIQQEEDLTIEELEDELNQIIIYEKVKRADK